MDNLTYAEARKNFIARLISLGIDDIEARREAEIALIHVSKAPAHELVLRANQNLEVELKTALDEILLQREQRVPLQYAIGETFFMGFKIAVGPGVLIPRADTETLVTAALEQIKMLGQGEKINMVEVGAGSGAVVISLLKLCPNLRATVFEISPQAGHFCRINALCHGVYDRLTIFEEDYQTGLAKLTGSFDLFVSNPPYIPIELASTLAAEVLHHEPALALMGEGEDGLGFYRKFSLLLPALAATSAISLLVEIGQGQAEAVSAIFEGAGWRDLRLHADLGGISRVLVARTGDKTI